MKKIAFTAVISILTLSLGINIAQPYDAYASTINQKDAQILNGQLETLKARLLELQKLQIRQSAAKQTVSISSENAASLKEGLTALTNVLIDLQTRLKNNNLSVNERKIVSAALSNIATKLVAVNFSLNGKNLAQNNEKSAKPQASVINNNEDKLAIEKTDIADEEFLSDNEIVQKENEQIASVWPIANSKKIPLPALIIGLIAIAAATTWFFMLKTKSQNAKAEAKA